MTRRLEWGGPEGREPPKHPFRDSALLYAVMAAVILAVAWLTGGDIPRAIGIAVVAFVAATAWSWWRWHDRLGQAKRRRP